MNLSLAHSTVSKMRHHGGRRVGGRRNSPVCAASHRAVAKMSLFVPIARWAQQGVRTRCLSPYPRLVRQHSSTIHPYRRPFSRVCHVERRHALLPAARGARFAGILADAAHERAQPRRSGGDAADCRRGGDAVPGLAGRGAADQRPAGNPRHAGPGQFARIRAAHHAQDVRGASVLLGIHAGLCDAGRQEQARRADPDPDPRYVAVDSDHRLPHLYAGVFPEPVSGAGHWGGMRCGFRHFHQPGVEHDLQLLPKLAHHARGSGRGVPRV